MSPERPSPPSRRVLSAARPAIFLWLCALTCLLRFPALLAHPFCIDESYYAAGAVELNAGGVFYRDVVDHKAPGIYFLYALIYRVAGAYNQTAVHVVLLLAASLGAYFVGLLAQELFGARAGRWAGSLYAIASVIGPANDFQAANTEIFTNLPLAAALWLCARLWTRARASRMETAVMGLLVGAAVLVRPQAGLVLLPIGITLWRRKVGWGTAVLVAMAASLPALALVASLWRADAIVDLRASMAYARYYTTCLPFEVKLANGSLKTLFFLAIDVGLVIPASMLLATGRRDRAWTQGAGLLLSSWLFASFVAAGAGGRFYPHYFIQVLPPLAVIAARQLTVWARQEAR